MSTLAVTVQPIRDIQVHPNADRLEIATVLGWQCVVQKGAFKPGDLCVYFPIDSILPEKVETAIFGPDSKIELSKHRVKTIKLRGAISQGLAVAPSTVMKIAYPRPTRENSIFEGKDLTTVLGVTKYEPLAPRNRGMSNLPKSWRKKNPHFHEYTDIENAKNYPGIITDGLLVAVTEKIHGTNFRAGWVPYEPDNWWKKLVAKLGFAPTHEFVFGSRKVQLHDPARLPGTGFYERTSNEDDGQPVGNVYEECVRKYDLKRLLKSQPDKVFYGEIYGSGIQKGYTYGCAAGERQVAFFDVAHSGQYMNYEEATGLMLQLGLPLVPQIGYGTFNAEFVAKAAKGASQLPNQPVKEGVVVKPLHESWDHSLGRVILKYINDDYLLKDQTEFH